MCTVDVCGLVRGPNKISVALPSCKRPYKCSWPDTHSAEICPMHEYIALLLSAFIYDVCSSTIFLDAGRRVHIISPVWLEDVIMVFPSQRLSEVFPFRVRTLEIHGGTL